MNYIKNPILIGTFAGVLTYLYMYWESENKYKKNPKSKRRPVNLITPVVVGLIVWFIASNYFEMENNTQSITFNSIPSKPNYKLASESIDSIGSKSYHLIGKNNVRLPPTDVFIDLVKY